MADAVTAFVAAFGPAAGDDRIERSRDVLLGAEATEVTAERRTGVRTLRGVFDSAADATRAAIDLLRVPGEDRSGDPEPVRVVVGTVETDGRATRDHVDRIAPLLGRAGPGQILVTASTAIMAGAALPRGAELYYRGRWRSGADGPPEQLYELRPPGDGDDGRTPANLHWARRALAGPRSVPVPATADALGAMQDAWRRVLSGDLSAFLLTAASPSPTALVSAELAVRLHAEGARILYGRWEQQPRDELQALREALGVYVDGRPTDTLRSEVDGRGEAISRLLPEVGARLGLPRRPGSDVDCLEAFEAVEAWLTTLADEQPTLVVLHDLPPADRLSAGLLGHLGHACRHSRIMLVITATDGAPAMDELLTMVAPGEDGILRHLRL